MGRRATREQIQDRYAELSAVLENRGWTLEAESALARRWRVKRAMVRKYKRNLLKRLARDAGGVEEVRAECATTVRGVIADARKAGEHGHALRGSALLADLYGVRQRAPEVAVTVRVEQVRDPMELLRIAQAGLRAAADTGLLSGPVIDADSEEIE